MFMKDRLSPFMSPSLTVAALALLMPSLWSVLAQSVPVQKKTSPNLIVGGDGEAGACTDDDAAVTTLPGWTVVKGNPSLLCYVASKYAVPKEGEPGKAFLAGGPYGESELRQVIDVSAARKEIDTGSTTYTLSGWLGGLAGDPGRAILTAAFLDEHQHALAKAAKLPAVTAADRGNRSAFLERTVSDRLPAGTRSISVKVQFIGLADHPKAGYADNLSLTLSTVMKAPVLEIPHSTMPGFDHVFLVMMENTTYGDVIGDLKNAPYINSLAALGTLLTHASGTYHPSDENYLAIAGGDSFVKGGVYFPNIRVRARHIGDQLEAAGKKWKGYEQGIGIPCGTSTQYDRYFEPDDLPFINFTNIRDDPARCQAHLVDISEMQADLQSTKTTPNFAWLAADDYDDGEASYDQGGLAKSLQVQDRWLRQTLEPIFNSAAWKTERTLVILTWDESYEPHENHVATILLGSDGMVRAGYRSPVPANHYSIGRTLEEALGIPPLTANDRYARPLNEAFSATKK
jgi:hypothetical protein